MCCQSVSHPILILQIHGIFPVEVQICLQPVELEKVLLLWLLFPAPWIFGPTVILQWSWGVTLGDRAAAIPFSHKQGAANPAGAWASRGLVGLKQSLLPNFRGRRFASRPGLIYCLVINCFGVVVGPGTR